MATIARLNVLLALDDSKFTRGLEGAKKRLDSWGESFRSAGTKLTAGLTTPLLASGVTFVKWAADLEQSVGATEVLWGDNSDAMLAWAKSADKSMGMTENQALQNANRFNAMFKTLGHGEGVVMDMSQGFTMLSADLSAMWGGSNTEAADALTSALRGNYEGLDKYNINLTEAMVSQEAMNVAMADGRTEVTEADKVQARYNLIMEQSADSQGQFARETDTTSGKLAINTARAKNAATAFGKMLLPAVNKLLDVFSSMVDWVEKLSDRQRKWVLIIAAVAAAIGPVLLVIGMLLPGLGALLSVLGFLLSPIGLIVLAVAALAAGLIYAYTHFDGFREAVNRVAVVISTVALAALDMLIEAFQKLKAAFDAGGWTGLFATLASMFANGLSQLASLAWEGVQWVAQQILAGAQLLLAAGVAWIQGLWDGAKSKWNEFTAWMGGLPPLAATAIGDITRTLWQKGVDLFIGLGDGAQVQWENLRLWLVNRGMMAVVAVGDLLRTLWQKGVDLFIGLGDGAQEQWQNLREWITQRGAQAFIAVGNVTRTLWQKGIDLLNGVLNGAAFGWVAVKTWFLGLPSRAISAVGNLAGTLWDAGWDLMWGLAQGIYAGAESLVSAAIGSVADMIPDWIKGPLGINSPSKVFREIGRGLPEGLVLGIEDGERSVQRAVASLASIPAIDTGTFSAPGFGNVGSGNGQDGTTVVNNWFVTPEVMNEVMAKAENGDSFARNFAGEIGMMEGAA